MVDSQIRINDPKIIAPCGLDCSLCRAYIRERSPCPGCRSSAGNKSQASFTCSIRDCAERAVRRRRFCFSCARYPCPTLLRLEKRYRTRYAVSVLDNLAEIQKMGVQRFVAEAEAKWSCPGCGRRLCMHKPQCPYCGRPRRNSQDSHQ